jgi:coenzyme F420-reducing hydrogenase delta subunit
LTTDIPILPKEEKCRPVKYHRVYSKGARKRMLKELIEENNLQNNRLSYNADNGKLENKIQEFYNSISEFCGQNATG